MKILSTHKMRVPILLFVLIFSACTSLKEAMNSWVGSSIDDLTSSWGVPELRAPRQDGGYTYTWITMSLDRSGEINQCRKTFVTDSKGIIVSGSYNGC